MNLEKIPSGRDPREFVSSVFDLAYGARDGSEKQSPAEVRASLAEAGVDFKSGWAQVQQILARDRGRRELAEARRHRVALTGAVSVTTPRETRESLIQKIKECIARLGPQPAGVFARKWDNCSVTDLTAIHTQMERQVERSKKV